MRSILRRAVPFVLAPCVVACGPAPPVDAGPAGTEHWMDLARKLRAKDPAARFVQATALFLGTPYVNGPLGEGDAGGPDPDPRCDFAHVDCVTFLEQSLALALADPRQPDSFAAALDRIRYRDGKVGYVTRNHYMVNDWIPANAWLVRDVTKDVGKGHLRRIERTIDRAAFLREHGAEPRPGLDDPRTGSLDFIPSDEVAAVAPALRSGDLVLWVGNVETIFIVHTGLLVRDADGTLMLRHGSSKAGHVLDESFADYAARSTFAQGFVVLRIRDDAAVPRTGRG